MVTADVVDEIEIVSLVVRGGGMASVNVGHSNRDSSSLSRVISNELESSMRG